ncbi:uncharacterized protein [Chiloscyllium punctatum]|uniref:uncharacterized protein n=1 Tax=Chiloscyllium punctatum TaxID=137246 RepID=UPI003B63C34D
MMFRILGMLRVMMLALLVLAFHQISFSYVLLTVPESDNPQVIDADVCSLVNCGDVDNQRQYRSSEIHLKSYGDGLGDGTWYNSLVTVHRAPFRPARDCPDKKCNPIYLTIRKTTWHETILGGVTYEIQLNETFGIEMKANGKDFLGCCFRISVGQGKRVELLGNKIQSFTPPDDPKVVKFIEVKDLKQTIEIETGYGDANAWVEWVKYTVKSLNKSNCYACASGRPVAQVVPFPLGWKRDRKGMKCMIALYQDETAWNDRNCTSLSLMFPPLEKKDAKVPPLFSAAVGNHTSCVRRRGTSRSKDLGELKLCTEIKNVTETEKGGNYSALKVPRADLWWYCGGKILRPTLPPDWRGICAIVQLAIPFTLAFEKENKGGKKGRGKRLLLDTSFDDRIYLDSVGVPRGVPDEFKARNQIAAGFESALFWWVTINKNVDWINYIFYNQQRFINYTRDAIKGISEQLDATSRMAWENRIALDMILAEKGGVCVMLGGSCCTFIPNNTAPDGSITRALRGLTTLAEELAENSGVDTSLTRWLESWFGKWKGVVVSILTSLIVVVGVLVAIGCCIIPCIRGLTQRLIETALMKQMPLKGNQVEGLYRLNNEQMSETKMDEISGMMLANFGGDA